MLDQQLSCLFAGPLFFKLMNNQQLNLLEFHTLTSILVNQNIPFDTAFVSGTRKNPQSLQLTIHINPSATLVFVVSLAAGSSVFSPSP